MPNTAPETAARSHSAAQGKVVHVAVGVVLNARGEVLIALRDEQRHQGGLWEFPGGKLEPGEDTARALARELLEEVHLQVEGAAPLLEIHHDYGDKRVFLDVWLVERFSGDALGREGQPLRWVPMRDLATYDFPAANAAIVKKLQTLAIPRT